VTWLGVPVPVWQAVIAGLFVAVGWIVNGWQNRRRDQMLRDERVRDVQRALFAEIRANVESLRRDDVAAYGARIAARIRAEPGFFPIVPTERNDTVFHAIVADIHILPRDSIDPIVLYYRQIGLIAAVVEDLRRLDVAVIGPDRAAALYGDYIALKTEAVEMGDEAMLMMDAHMDGGSASQRAIKRGRDDAEAVRLRAGMDALRADLRRMADQ
jgi:hypothetical protein